MICWKAMKTCELRSAVQVLGVSLPLPLMLLLMMRMTMIRSGLSRQRKMEKKAVTQSFSLLNFKMGLVMHLLLQMHLSCWSKHYQSHLEVQQ